MNSNPDVEFTHRLPKAELHAHLSGSISKECLHDIWLRKRSQGQCLNLEDPLTAIRAGADGFVDVTTFFPLFDRYIYNLCGDVESVKCATERGIKDVEEDGVRYLELQKTPRGCLDADGKEAGRLEYVKAVNDVVHQWDQASRHSTDVYLILSIDRRMTAEQASEVVDLAIEYQYGLNNFKPSYEDRNPGYVVGVDLCGNPTKGTISTFTPAFGKAKAHGLGITAHFAEVPHSSSNKELNTILSWEPDRLGHCIFVPTQTKKLISACHVGIEICLSCNVLAKLTIGGFAKHHFSEWMLTTGSPVALGTDDVGIFGSPLSKEYLLAAKNSGLGRKSLLGLSRSALSIAFAGKQRMTELLDDFEHELKLATSPPTDEAG